MSRQDQSRTEKPHCPKCGEQAHNAYALLGHIYTNHWILDDDELPEGYDE